MRPLTALLLLLLFVGVVACEINLAEQAVQSLQPDPGWRRTETGWVKVGAAGAAALADTRSQPVVDPPLHPLVVASFLLLSSVALLVAFDGRGTEPNR